MKFLNFLVLFLISLENSNSIVVKAKRAPTPSALSPPVIETFVTKGEEEDLVSLIPNPDSEIIITETLVKDDGVYNHIVLVCNATYPIEWIYEGDGAPRLYTSHIRTFQDFYKKSTYEYSVFLVLFQERFNEQQTGNYICASIEQQDVHSSRYLYFNGDFGFPSTTNRVIQPKENDAVVTLPCRATDPLSKMSLYKIFPEEEAANLTSSKSISYDPKFGFDMRIKDFPNPYGTYFCQLNDIDSFWKIDLIPPKNKDVKAVPSQEIVWLENFSNQIFTCRAKEKVTIVQPNTYDLGFTEHYQNLSDEYPYVAVLKMSQELPLFSAANYFKIHCQTKRDHRIMHTWEFTSFGPEEISIKYDKYQKRLLCCSKSGLTPAQEFSKCETDNDCEIKKNCFKSGRCKESYSPVLLDAPRGCTAADFSYTLSTYAVRCSVGNKEKIVAVTPTVKKDDLIVSSWSSKGVPATEKLLRITVLNTKKNEELRIRCVGNVYFLSSNFVFALEMWDGSIQFPHDASVNYNETHSPILHKQVDPKVKNVICFAPLARSSDWINVTVSVTTSPNILPKAISSTLRSNSYFNRRNRRWRQKKRE